MAHERLFSTSTLQDLSNGIKNTSRQSVLAPTIELWSFGSPKGLQVLTFGSMSLIFTLASKWGCDKGRSSWMSSNNMKDQITTWNSLNIKARNFNNPHLFSTLLVSMLWSRTQWHPYKITLLGNNTKTPLKLRIINFLYEMEGSSKIQVRTFKNKGWHK